MSDELKRRLVGVGVLLAVFSLIAWWVGSRDEQAGQIPQSDSLVRNYDVRDLDRIAAAQQAQQAVPEPAGEAQAPADAEAGDQEQAAEAADNGKPAETETQAPAPQKKEPVETAAAPKAQSKPADEPVEKPSSESQPTGGKPATDPNGQWIVQVASVTQKDNAEALAKRLGKKGWNSFVEQGVVNGTTYYRVRVGPYAGRDGADRAAGGLQEELDQKVAVMSR